MGEPMLGGGLWGCGLARDPAYPPLSPPPWPSPAVPREAFCPQRSLSLLFKSTWSFLLVSRRSSVLSTWAPGGHRDDLSSGWGRERARSLSAKHRVAGRNDYIMKVHPRLGCWH